MLRKFIEINWAAPAFAVGFLAISAATQPVAAQGIPVDVAVPEDSATAGVTTITPWEVYQFLERYCAECHGGHLKKPKGQLGYILNLRKLDAEGYIIPGAPEISDVYLALVSTDPDILMPPEDSEGPKPTEEEIAHIHDWIAAGAVIDPVAPEPTDPPTQEDIEAEPITNDAAPSPGRVIGRMHPLVVHFPVALLICAAGAAIFASSRPRDHWLHGMVRGCLWIGAASAVIAAITGWLGAGFEGFVGDDVDRHRWLGITTAVVSVIALVTCEFLSRINAVRWNGGRRLQALLLLLLAVIVSATGHTGGLLSYGADYFWGF